MAPRGRLAVKTNFRIPSVDPLADSLRSGERLDFGGFGAVMLSCLSVVNPPLSHHHGSYRGTGDTAPGFGYRGGRAFFGRLQPNGCASGTECSPGRTCSRPSSIPLMTAEVRRRHRIPSDVARDVVSVSHTIAQVAIELSSHGLTAVGFHGQKRRRSEVLPGPRSRRMPPSEARKAKRRRHPRERTAGCRSRTSCDGARAAPRGAPRRAGTG